MIQNIGMSYIPRSEINSPDESPVNNDARLNKGSEDANSLYLHINGRNNMVLMSLFVLETLS